MNKIKITRDNWQGLLKFSLNRLRADSALIQAALTLYLAWIVGSWSLDGGYIILGLYLSKKLLLCFVPILFAGYFYYDLNKVWIAEQKFNADNHPFTVEFKEIKKELAEIKKHFGIGQERPIRTFWNEPNGC